MPRNSSRFKLTKRIYWKVASSPLQIANNTIYSGDGECQQKGVPAWWLFENISTKIKFFKRQIILRVKSYEDAVSLFLKIVNNVEKKLGQTTYVGDFLFENVSDVNEAKKYFQQSISDPNGPLFLQS